MCQSYWMGCYSNALHPLHSPKNILGLLSVILCVKLSKWGFENTSGVKVNEGRGERLAANSNLSKSLYIRKAIPLISRDWTLSRFRKVVWSEWLRAGGACGWLEVNAEELMTCGYCLAVEFVYWSEWFLQSCRSHGASSPCLGTRVVEIKKVWRMVPAEAIAASANSGGRRLLVVRIQWEHLGSPVMLWPYSVLQHPVQQCPPGPLAKRHLTSK